jgi:hypothetical protein
MRAQHRVGHGVEQNRQVLGRRRACPSKRTRSYLGIRRRVSPPPGATHITSATWPQSSHSPDEEPENRKRAVYTRIQTAIDTRQGPGRPRVKPEVEQLIVRMASENRDWGYDRIAGALANLGHKVSDQTIGNILQRHGLPPAPERKRTTTWPAFIRTHLALLAGTDFFTAEVLTLRGLVTYYVLFFIHLESRRVDIAGITVHPDERWMQQIARNVTMEGCGILTDCRYLLHDRDTKYTPSFRAIITSGQVEPLALPAHSPNLNAYAERWVRSVKEECLSKIILFGERSLRRALSQYVEHYHDERNHQGKGNVLLFPRNTHIHRERQSVQCRERLGGLLRYYHKAA